jgi:hypothetical protein
LQLDFKHCRQLHGIVTPERMRIGQKCGPLQHGHSDLSDPVILAKILAEQPQGLSRLCDAQSGLAATTSEGGSYFDF